MVVIMKHTLTIETTVKGTWLW